jgi:hypothetical protein
MSDTAKDTIYIDIDDEITAIIDKLGQSEHKIVALVLPKRATVLQSIVNMKLLKRSADAKNKNIVLITSEASLLPIAGAVKVHVAKTMQSKPVIPPAPQTLSDDIQADDNEGLQQDEDEDEAGLDASKSVGSLAAASAVNKDDEETIELDEDLEDIDAAKDDSKKPKKKSNKKKIPNFDTFRKRLLIGGGIFVGLIVLFFIFNTILPKAKIVIKSDNISVNTDVPFTANTAFTSFDADAGKVPATKKDVSKTDSTKVPATGQKNIGDKATGTVTLKNCAKVDGAFTIPAGTVVTTGASSFSVNETTLLPSSTFSGTNTCTTAGKTVNVTSTAAGDQYNISGGRTFAVSGVSSITGVDSSAMSGGTNKLVSVVSDQDVETAKQKIADKSKDSATTDLKQQFSNDDLFLIPESITSSAANMTATPKVGEEASEVTVSSTTVYSGLGVKESYLNTLVENSAKKQIDTTKQAISDNGLSKAIFRLEDKKSATDQRFRVQSTVSTGTQIDQEALKKEIAGKKKGDVQDLIGKLPGVKDVNVSYSPFWVYKTPSNPSKITITIEQAQ